MSPLAAGLAIESAASATAALPNIKRDFIPELHRLKVALRAVKLLAAIST
jgi:hypothetical protein